MRRRSFWGWGYEDEQPSQSELEQAGVAIREQLGFAAAEVERPVSLDQVELPPPRLEPPASLASLCRSDPYERASHTYGKAYRDVVRAFRGRFDHPPDVVAHPGDERELEQLLTWCEEAGAAAIPFGGGTSVVGGVEPRLEGDWSGAVTIDLRRMDRVLEVDAVSLAARIQAGASGPRLEAQLKEHGLTLRHYPQSFELATLGGWIATRAGGHFATLYTHIDDLVESVRALTPRGVWESRRLPASGAGPSPDRLLLGSEGILGVITEAWMRVQRAPDAKESAAVLFESFEAGARAVRALGQSRLFPANCRLLDPAEAALTAGVEHGRALLVLGFEAAGEDVEPWLRRALELCRDHGGEPRERSGESEGAWRDTFLRAPYLRDTLVAAGVLAETFETAVTWDRLDELVAGVREQVGAALGEGRLMCRLTHVYPDGAAPYFTVLAPARRGAELEQWDELKAVAAEAIQAAGGTITHHHAVGRDHLPWYERQRPEPFAQALRAAKAAVDPAGMLNPGVLLR